MSVQLLSGIGGLDPDSLCYSLYTQLYNNFFNAQDKKSDTNPYGITEGDDTSVRLRNTAYNFADAIAGAVEGGGSGGGGVLIDYLKKSGGDMSGVFRANYGFEAGIGNTRVVETYFEDNRYGIHFYGDVRIGGENLYLSGKQLIRYDSANGMALILCSTIDFGGSSLKSTGEMLFGVAKELGVYISQSTIQVKGKNVWHEGNASLPSVDWSMFNATVAGELNVSGTTNVSGVLVALNGFELGASGSQLLYGSKETITATGFISFATGYGIKIGGIPVLMRVDEGHIQLSAAGADLLLGSEQTNKIRLLAGISDIDGDIILLSKYGAAHFPDSLVVRHNYGDELLSSYRVDSFDEGMIIHKYLRFGTSIGVLLHGDEQELTFSSVSEYTKEGKKVSYICRTRFGHRLSESLYKPLNRDSNSFYISTDADFITLEKPLEAKGHVGIDGSYTRLMENSLYFTNENYLLAVEGGIKHYGNATFLGGLSSEYFSSGFAGAGWAILKNQTTGNVVATFDELIVRKKMRIYELEVQKNSATNGSLWISDSCNGDSVTKLNN